MEIQKINNNLENTNPDNEKILVVERKKLFQGIKFDGFLTCETFTSYLEIIHQNKEFRWRSEMEQNTDYKQIIPYLVFSFEDQIFVMQRRDKASEKRLKNKYSLGIGGHIRQEDLASNDIFEWAKREFNEEVSYYGSLNIKPLGLINDESTEVGRVHFGLIVLLTGNTNKISVKSELKSGMLVTLQNCQIYYDNMETWSQLVFNHLKSGNL